MERGAKVRIKEGKFAGETGLVSCTEKGAHGMIARICLDGHWDDGTCYPHGQDATWTAVDNLELV